MIHPKKLNNVENWQINMIKLFGLDWKSQFRMIIILFFTWLSWIVRKHVKIALKWPKISQDDIIWHYLRVFEFKKGICYVCKADRLCWPDLIQFGYQIQKQISNFSEYFFFYPIICPSLGLTPHPSYFLIKKWFFSFEWAWVVWHLF